MFFSDGASFPNVDDGKINIILFLEASKRVVKFVELLGSVFAPIKYDINGNIEKLYNIHNTDKEKFVTLNDILEFELNEPEDSLKVGIDALLWLKRALEYICVFLTCLVEDNKEGKCTDNLYPFFNKAYEEKLKPYHGWLVQKLFSLIVHAAPSRKSLFKLLAEEEECSETEIIRDAEVFMEGLARNLDVINNFYQRHNLDSNAKV